MTKGMKALEVLKALIVAYIITGLALAALAFAVYKLELNESTVNIIITVIYIAASFIGAFITGKRVKEKKFLWGAILGLAYIFVIYVAAAILSKGFNLTSTTSITAFFLCMGGGLLGGMLS